MIFHQCLEQEMIAVGKNEPSGTTFKCKCRQQVSSDGAQQLVDEGKARRLVTKRWYEPVEVACKLCKGDETFKQCARCHDKRTEVENMKREEFGDAIVAVSAPSVDKTLKYRPVVTGKTPRTQTIEKAHMERLVQGRKDEVERIEVYGTMITDIAVELGAQLSTVPSALIRGTAEYEKHKRVIKEGKPEPEDNAALGTGRRYDYGRAI